MPPPPVPYVLLGEAGGVRRLVDRFYDLMEVLPQAQGVRAMHAPDLTGARQNLFDFLSGWLGGPPIYMERKGHPRLRMRHMPFAIGPAERDAWMQCMQQALTEQVPDESLRTRLILSFSQMADHLVNLPRGDEADGLTIIG